MNSPCEILVDGCDEALAASLLDLAAGEAERIENKYSRYRSGTVVDQINRRAGERLEVDPETADLLDYAASCFELSDGLFDITTGVLRRIWTFDARESSAPSEAALSEALSHMGWKQVRWERPWITLPAGFQVDFGGICKEYAADRILGLIRRRHPVSVLVNLGGDIAAAGERAWSVGVEDADPSRPVSCRFPLRRGGIATSGSTKRFTRVNGKLLGHILNPKTGRPVDQAPSSVTVAAATCTEAGFWSTMGMLQGAHAESFLQAQGLPHWCSRA